MKEPQEDLEKLLYIDRYSMMIRSPTTEPIIRCLMSDGRAWSGIEFDMDMIQLLIITKVEGELSPLQVVLL